MGTEEFWIPAVIAAVSGGAQAYSASAANSRSNAAAVQNIQEQQDLQNQAAGGVNKVIQQAQNQSQTAAALKQQSLTDYTNQLRGAAASAQATAPTTGAPGLPGASKRYAAQTAAGTQQAQQFADTNANEAADIQGTLRGQQVLGNSMQDEGTNLGLLDNESSQASFINSLRSQAAGQVNPWASFGTGLGLSTAGALAGSGLLKGGTPPVNTGYNSSGYGGFTQAGTPIAAGGTDSSGYINSLKNVYGNPSYA